MKELLAFIVIILALSITGKAEFYDACVADHFRSVDCRGVQP